MLNNAIGGRGGGGVCNSEGTNLSLERMKTFRFSKDPVARAQALKEEILFLLITHSNLLSSYQGAIDAVQLWLTRLVEEDLSQHIFIRDVAEEAGQEFLKKVGEAKMQEKVRRGEFPFSISIK